MPDVVASICKAMLGFVRVQVFSGSNFRISQEEVQKIQELKEEGKSSREIANEIGVSHTAINKLETSDTCPKLPDSPEPSNIIPSPVQFQKQESDGNYLMLDFDSFLRGSSPQLSKLDR